MFNRKELKEEGKQRFINNYWLSVLASFLLGLCAMTLSFPTDTNNSQEEMHNIPGTITPEILGIPAGVMICCVLLIMLLRVLVANPLAVGCYAFFRENTERTAEAAELMDGFKHYRRAVLTMLLRDVFLFLWLCLFIVPGLVKAYSYRMVPFIIRDNPNLSPNEAITRSRKMMDGHKANVFIFALSYIGWYLLGLFTCGLVWILWAEPYRQNANALIYKGLVEGRFSRR